MNEAFPPDLPALLRLACRQGKMRLNVWHGAEKGHQANLANCGDGWTVDHDRDSLEAITKVLRIRFGKMLERERAGDRDADRAIHPAHQDDSRHQFTEATAADDAVDDDDIREAIAFQFRRIGADFSDDFIAGFVEGVLDALYGKARQPNLHDVEMTTARASAAAVDDDLDFEALIG